MSRLLALSTVLLLGAGVAAEAQVTQPYPPGAYAARAPRSAQRVAPNGRCNGISYGTGARSCGTRTGGPVGGINSRN